MAAMNSCRCGFYGDAQTPCTCAQAMATKYQKRISGPLLDRIDIHIEVLRVECEKLSNDRMGESSESIRARVQAARDFQRKRFATEKQNQKSLHSVICNGDMCVGQIRQFCQLQDEGQSWMRADMTQLNLSALAYHRILKLARARADLAVCKSMQAVHLAEALQYRPKLIMG